MKKSYVGLDKYVDILGTQKRQDSNLEQLLIYSTSWIKGAL
jgi:hypothetical protein